MQLLAEQNYPQLQNLIKRDPAGYEEEFVQQYQHFLSAWALLGTVGQIAGRSHLEAMLMFIAHCCTSYRHTADSFSSLILSSLQDVDQLGRLDGSLRRAIVQAALLLKRERILEAGQLIPVLFRLLRIKDKGLRELVSGAVKQDLRRATPQTAKHILNFLEETVLAVDGLDEEIVGTAAVQSLSILISVYAAKQQTFGMDSARPVNIIANAGLNGKHQKLTLLALNFLIGQYNTADNYGDDDDDGNEIGGSAEGQSQAIGHETIRQAQHRLKIAGKTKGRQKQLERLLKKSAKHRSQKAVVKTQFPAIQLIYDPQRYAEKLLSNLKTSRHPFEVKLVMMNALSLIVSVHQLVLPDFYPFLLRYLQPHQRHVTKVLCFAAQSAHSMLPGEILSTTIRAIANNFVADHCASAVIAAGLNAIRECCSRCPGAMDEALLGDLVQYKGYKDKSVVMAARSLIGLYRRTSPELLHRRDRGRPERKSKNGSDMTASGQESEDGDDEDGNDENENRGSDDDGSEASSDGCQGVSTDDSDSPDIIHKAQSELLTSPQDMELLAQSTGGQPGNPIVNPDSIFSVKERLSKQERLQSARTGRKQDRKFGAAGKTAEHRASGKSMSNKVKRRGKLMQMLKRSRAGLYGGKTGVNKKKR